MSPVFRLPVLRSSHGLRFAGQQAVKRLPARARPVLGIPPGRNPVTLGLWVQGLTDLAVAEPGRCSHLAAEIDETVSMLEAAAAPGHHGRAWGYDFHWESRFARFPAGTPTVVATGFVANGLFRAARLLGNPNARRLTIDAAEFVLRELHRTQDSDGDWCFSYSAVDTTAVLNASMKAARLCAQSYAFRPTDELIEAVQRATAFVVKAQRSDGAWPYSVSDERNWVDNFHTGYVLDALADCRDLVPGLAVDSAVQRGWEYYRQNFFEADVIPRYYDRRTYPVDSTACAQSVITLIRFGDLETARNVAEWTIAHLQRRDGGFAYRRHRAWTDQSHYMRWSSAWMFAALSRLAMAGTRG